MRTHMAAALVATIALWPSLAGAQDITRDWDRTYDFTTIRTFAVKIGTSWGNPLSENRVRDDVAAALAEKGWKPAAEASADALVVLHGASETKHDLTTFYNGWGGWRYGGLGSTSTMVNDYLVGTLVADIFDAKSKKLVYRGSASGEVSKDPEKNVKKAEKAAQKMFKDFPPKAKS